MIPRSPVQPRSQNDHDCVAPLTNPLVRGAKRLPAAGPGRGYRRSVRRAGVDYGRLMEHYTRDTLVFDVTDAGPRHAEVVVLLHGFPQDRTAWGRVSPLLHTAGLRTLAPDQRGYSRRSRPAGRTAYRLCELTDDVVALLDAAGLERAHLVGHDWGGAVAWALASRHPERLASLTVLSTPHPAAMAWAFTHGAQALHSWYMLAFQVPWLPEEVLARRLEQLFTTSGLSAQDAAHYVARFSAPGELTGPLAWYRAMPASAAMLKSLRPKRLAVREAMGGDRAPRPLGITVPTTYVWGTKDFALGRAAAERTGQHVSADYRFVELSAGHWLPEKRADQVAAEITGRVGSSGASD